MLGLARWWYEIRNTLIVIERRRLPLATLDSKLATVAHSEKVKLLGS